MTRLLRLPAAILVALTLLVASAAMVSAHTPHTANGQIIANGQNHYAFVAQGDGTYLTCDTFAQPFPNVGPAWFGVETAHHGPDSGDPGKGDGCYLADAAPTSEVDDVNPAID